MPQQTNYLDPRSHELAPAERFFLALAAFGSALFSGGIVYYYLMM